MSDVFEFAPFTVLVDDRPGIWDGVDVVVVVRGPFGSYCLSVDVAGHYCLSHDLVPGLDDVPLVVLADGCV